MCMRSFFVSVVLSVMTFVSVMAQNVDLPIAVAKSKQQMTEKVEVLQLLKSKLSSAMTESGMGMADYSGIIVSPQTTITNKHIVEGGMKNIYIYDVDLSLVVSQVITGTVFYSINLTLRGEGYSKDGAIMASIRTLSGNDKRLTTFFSEARTRILNYYKNNTPNILTKARTLASMQQFGEAVALLASYPETLPQYKTVAAAMKEIYATYQQKACNDILQKAKGAYALGNYEESVQWLNEIDMSSPCANDAAKLAAQIKQSIKAEQAQIISLYEKQIQSEANIEKQRIQAIENIATAYYKNQSEFYLAF